MTRARASWARYIGRPRRTHLWNRRMERGEPFDRRRGRFAPRSGRSRRSKELISDRGLGIELKVARNERTSDFHRFGWWAKTDLNRQPTD